MELASKNRSRKEANKLSKRKIGVAVDIGSLIDGNVQETLRKLRTTDREGIKLKR